jgi:hypothetical protein
MMDAHRAPQSTPQFTLVALFDDTMDAEHALAALRHEQATERVSLIVRSAAGGDEERQPVELARTLVANALDAVGTWLSGLAALVVPDRGEYLVAGPLGVALTAARVPAAPSSEAKTDQPWTDDVPAERDLLHGVLTRFGFGGDEATYLERRLEAGAALIAVTDDRKDAVQAARRLFADHSAVYLGMARTDERLMATVEGMLAAAPRLRPAGDVIVADAVAPLRHATAADASPAMAALLGRPAIDARGEPVGEVDDALYEAPAVEGARPVPRYLIVGAGGVLGIHRKRVAVPATLATTLEDGRVALAASAEAVHDAPPFAQEPFSRRDEQGVHRHFGAAPYWAAGPPELGVEREV